MNLKTRKININNNRAANARTYFNHKYGARAQEIAKFMDKLIETRQKEHNNRKSIPLTKRNLTHQNQINYWTYIKKMVNRSITA